jgi:hypothetical protein
MIGQNQPQTSDRLVPYDRLGPYGLVMRDVVDGRMYMHMTPPLAKVTRWNCICHPELKYRRPHFTCLMFCRLKRVAQGRLLPLIPVSRYRMYIQLDRPHAHFKDWLLRKFVLPIAEWLAN